MARATINYTHGDTGTKPGNPLDFQKNERPIAAEFDWYWHKITESVKGHSAEFTRLDYNDDGIVDESDSVTPGGELKGDLFDSLGNQIYDDGSNYILQNRLQNDSVTVTPGTGIASAGTVALGGSVTVNVDDSRYVLEGGDTMSGVLTLNDGSTAASRSWVNANADVPNADHANTAGDADTLDGQHYSDIQTWVNNNADVPNADYADSAGDANTLDGHDSTYFTTLSEVNANADVPNADYANAAGDADTVDGADVYVQSTEPTSATDGDIWIDTS